MKFHCTGNVTQQAHAFKDVASKQRLPWQHRFVVKTVDEAGRKVFINVCGSAKVPAPGGWKPGQVKLTDLPPSACHHMLSVWRLCSGTAPFVSAQNHGCRAHGLVLAAQDLRQPGGYLLEWMRKSHSGSRGLLPVLLMHQN